MRKNKRKVPSDRSESVDSCSRTAALDDYGERPAGSSEPWSTQLEHCGNYRLLDEISTAESVLLWPARPLFESGCRTVNSAALPDTISSTLKWWESLREHQSQQRQLQQQYHHKLWPSSGERSIDGRCQLQSSSRRPSRDRTSHHGHHQWHSILCLLLLLLLWHCSTVASGKSTAFYWWLFIRRLHRQHVVVVAAAASAAALTGAQAHLFWRRKLIYWTISQKLILFCDDSPPPLFLLLRFLQIIFAKVAAAA